jgi:hypothetical protein
VPPYGTVWRPFLQWFRLALPAIYSVYSLAQWGYLPRGWILHYKKCQTHQLYTTNFSKKALTNSDRNEDSEKSPYIWMEGSILFIRGEPATKSFRAGIKIYNRNDVKTTEKMREKIEKEFRCLWAKNPGIHLRIRQRTERTPFRKFKKSYSRFSVTKWNNFIIKESFFSAKKKRSPW